MDFVTPWKNRPDFAGIVCPPPEETHVKQCFRDECDIHTILRRVENGGDPSVLQARKGFYADLSGLPVHDLVEAYGAVSVAEEAFFALPADIRSKFNNDPYEFAEYVTKHGADSVAPLFGEKAVPTEPERKNATTASDDAKKSEGETA